MSRQDRIAKERVNSKRNINRRANEEADRRYHARYSDRDAFRGANAAALGAGWATSHPRAYARMKMEGMSGFMHGGVDLMHLALSQLRYGGRTYQTCANNRETLRVAHGIVQQLEKDLPFIFVDKAE